MLRGAEVTRDGRAALAQHSWARYGASLVSLVLILCIASCGTAGDVRAPASNAEAFAKGLVAFPASPIPCTVRLDPDEGGGPASGLVVRCEVAADSAGALIGRASLWQARRDLPVSWANARGSDRTNSSLLGGTPVTAKNAGPGRAAFEFWFPGSELFHDARPGEARVLIEVYREDATRLPPTRYACRIPKLEPARFVRGLPGSRGPWPALRGRGRSRGSEGG